MPKFKIYAQSRQYEVPIEAEDEADAFDKIEDWISDDFEDFEVTGEWEFEAIGVDDNA